MPPRAILQTLERLGAALVPLQLPMALMGGLALSVWRHVRATQDIDLLIAADESSVDQLVRSVTAAGFRPKRTPPVIAVGATRILQLEFDPDETFVTVQVDLLLADSTYARQALKRRVTVDLPDFSEALDVLTCEDLILHKLLAGRIIDRADSATLLRLNRTSIDWDYLRDWVERLLLREEFREVWTEAFPDDAPPE